MQIRWDVSLLGAGAAAAAWGGGWGLVQSKFMCFDLFTVRYFVSLYVLAFCFVPARFWRDSDGDYRT